MKQSEFKKLIKESVREAIQEELKDILLEAVKGNKQSIVESYQPDVRTLNFNTNSITPIPLTPNINTKIYFSGDTAEIISNILKKYSLEETDEELAKKMFSKTQHFHLE